MALVYIMKNKINGKCYVGQTNSSIDVRISQHLCEAKGGKTNSLIHKALRKYGMNNFEIKTINCFSEDQNDLNCLEQIVMTNLDTLAPNGYNLKEAGSNGRHLKETKEKMSKSHKGKKFSKEHKEKISVANKGRRRESFSIETRKKMSEAQKARKPFSKETRIKISKANRGKVRSEEFKQKISKANKGKHLSYDTEFKVGHEVSEVVREKISKSLIGHKLTEKTKQKLSELRRGRKHPRARAILLIHSDGEKEYFSYVSKACEKYNLHGGALSLVARNKQKYHKGFKCKYLEEK